MPAGLHHSEGEMEAFHNDNQYLTRPTVNLQSIQQHILDFSAELFFFPPPLFSDCDRFEITNPA